MRFFVFIISLSVCFGGCASHLEALKTGHEYRLFFPAITLATADAERIESVVVTLSCASFRAVTLIPNDWSEEVISPVSERTEFRASCGHGSSALWNLRDLDGSIVILVGDASCFDISAMVVSTTSDHERRHQLSQTDLILKP